MNVKASIGIVTCAFVGSTLNAAPLESAVISKKINEVNVSEKSAAAKAAASGQKIGKSSTVLTGRDSRAELSFPDQTITRIGANSIFRFTSGTRDMAIDKGSFLLQVPKNAGGATIRTATITAVITGTTTMMEYSPGQWVKFICLEGEAELTNKFGKKMIIRPGMMVVMNPEAEEFPAPVFVNLQKLVASSLLTDSKVFGSLSEDATILIAQAIANQLEERREATIVTTGLQIRGSGVWEEYNGEFSSGEILEPGDILSSIEAQGQFPTQPANSPPMGCF